MSHSITTIDLTTNQESNENQIVLIDLTTESPIETEKEEKTDNGHECPVCYEIMNHTDKLDAVRTLACGHVFHEKCIYTWIILQKHDDCPLCRTFVGKR